MANDQITRSDIISDDAIKWGSEYVKYVNEAIGKNKEFVDALKVLNEQTSKGRLAKDVQAFVEAQKKANEEAEKTKVILTEQVKLENQLATVKKKNELATSDTNKALIEERLLLAQTNAAIKKETLERLGLTGAYAKMSDARTKAKKTLQDLLVAENASTEAVKRAQKEFDVLDKKVRAADKATGDYAKNVGNYKSAFEGLGPIFSAFGIAGGITGVISLGKEIFNTTKELQSLDLALKSVTGTQAEFEKQQSFLNNIAGKYGLEIQNLTKQYTLFYVAAKDKLAANDIQEVFENISRSGSALGLSNATLERSFMAINQMLSKGTVAAEELRGQLAESMPGAVQAMTAAVQKLHPELKNLTEKDLFEMIKNGEILAKDVLPETARQLAKITGADAAKGVDTLAKSTNRLSNEWTDLVRNINEGSGALTSFFNFFIKGGQGYLLMLNRMSSSWSELNEKAREKGQSQGKDVFNGFIGSKEGDDAVKESESLIRVAQRNIKTILSEIKKTQKELNSLSKQNIAQGILGGYDSEQFFKEELEKLMQRLGEAEGIKKAALDRISKEKAPKSLSGSGTSQGKNIILKNSTDDSAFKLDKQTLEFKIAINDAVAKDDKETDETRIKAAEQRSKKEIELLELVRDNELKTNKEKYDNAIEYAKAKRDNDLLGDKMTAEKRQKIEQEYQKSVNEAKNAALKNNDLLRIEEKYQYDKKAIIKKTQEEIDKINEFDVKKYEDSIKLKMTINETQQNDALTEEEKRFAAEFALIKDNDDKKKEAEEKHQEEIFQIKKEYAIKAAKLQISELEIELKAYKDQTEDTKENAQFIADIEKKISEAKLKLYENEASEYKSKEKEKVKSTKEQTEEILKISSEMLGELSNLSNAFSMQKIQNLESEIEKNNEFFDKQSELAGDDERQKKEIEKERELRNKEVEKKIAKEKEKQAKIDKAAAIAQILIQGALAQLTATNQIGPIAGPILAGALTAIALATAIATPIPKFKHGTKNAPKGLAIVGDGGRPEVVTDSKGNNPYITPSTDTLVHLNRGDVVHKSIEDFNAFRLSQMKKISQVSNVYNDDKLIDEMRLTRKAIERQKLNVNLKTQKIDVSHLIWASKNRSW